MEAIDVLSGGAQQLGRVLGADPEPRCGARRSLCDQLIEFPVELRDLVIEAGDAASKRSQRELGCLQQLAGPGRIGTQPRAQARLTERCERRFTYRAPLLKVFAVSFTLVLVS